MENIMGNLPGIVSALLVIVAVLVCLTNIVTEVLKNITGGKAPANMLALAVAMVLTLCAFFALCQYYGLPATWYFVLAAVVVGFMVSYAAMFGYDKLRQLLEQFAKKDGNTTSIL